jgi:hypothetical protein
MFAFPLCSRFLASVLSCTMSIYAQTPGNTWKLLGKSERLFFQIPRSSTDVSCKRTAVNRKSRRQVGGCFKMFSRMNSLRNVFHSARSRSEKVQEPFRPLRNHILHSIHHIFHFSKQCSWNFSRLCLRNNWSFVFTRCTHAFPILRIWQMDFQIWDTSFGIDQ